MSYLHAAIAAARPKASVYTLWDGTLAHFGVRVHPSGVKSFIVQTRVRGRMRKLTLGRFPDIGAGKARAEAAAILARLWGGEAVAPARKARAPLFRDFAPRYRATPRPSCAPKGAKERMSYATTGGSPTRAMADVLWRARPGALRWRP